MSTRFLPERDSDYRLNKAVLFSFDDGAFGVRLSPSHPPVVASAMSCPKEGGVVAVYAQFSEPVNNAPGALGLDYGNIAMTCAVGAESASEDQFLCANATAGQPFSPAHRRRRDREVVRPGAGARDVAVRGHAGVDHQRWVLALQARDCGR